MNATVLTLARIEFSKLWHKKESYLYLTMWLVPLMYGIGFASGSSNFSYSGDAAMSALETTRLFFQMTFQFFVFYIFIIIVAARALGAEVDDHSILLYVPRINSRARVYVAKALAVTAFATIGLVGLALVSLAAYYGLLVRSPVASGQLSTGADLVSTLVIMSEVYVTFLLFAALGFVLSLYMKTLVAVATGTVALIALVLVGQMAPVAYAVPFFYLVRTGDIINHAVPPHTAGNPNIWLWTDAPHEVLAIMLAVTAAWVAAMTIAGRRRFRALDL